MSESVANSAPKKADPIFSRLKQASATFSRPSSSQHIVLAAEELSQTDSSSASTEEKGSGDVNGVAGPGEYDGRQGHHKHKPPGPNDDLNGPNNGDDFAHENTDDEVDHVDNKSTGSQPTPKHTHTRTNTSDEPTTHQRPQIDGWGRLFSNDKLGLRDIIRSQRMQSPVVNSESVGQQSDQTAVDEGEQNGTPDRHHDATHPESHWGFGFAGSPAMAGRRFRPRRRASMTDVPEGNDLELLIEAIYIDKHL